MPASEADAAKLAAEWSEEASHRVSMPEFYALARALLLPRSVSGDVKYHLGIVQVGAPTEQLT